MKKALTIWVDDDADLTFYQATFVCRKKNDREKQSVNIQSATIPEGIDALYLPWEIVSGAPISFFKEAEA